MDLRLIRIYRNSFEPVLVCIFGGSYKDIQVLYELSFRVLPVGPGKPGCPEDPTSPGIPRGPSRPVCPLGPGSPGKPLPGSPMRPARKIKI